MTFDRFCWLLRRLARAVRLIRFEAWALLTYPICRPESRTNHRRNQ